MPWLNSVASYAGARNGNRKVSVLQLKQPMGTAAELWLVLGGMGWKRMKDTPTVPPAQGIGFSGVTDHDGSVSRASCLGDRE